MRASAALTALVVVVATLAIPVPAQADPPGDYALLDGVTLRTGDRGAAVVALQRALRAAGQVVALDGIFGQETWAAVRRFQAAHGCAVDGVVGPETKRALDRALGAAPAPAPAPGGPAAGIPPRPAGAAPGSQVLAAVRGLPRGARDAALVRELRAGNVPDFLRTFRELTFTGGGRTVTVRVLPDYVAVGHDGDFVRVALGAVAAQQVADAFGCLLPTTRIVDHTFARAPVRLVPQPLPPTAAMTGVDYLLRHEARVEEQRRGQPLGALTAGHKKDVVLTNRLATRPDRVAIYGWHRPSGVPIQPLSLVHEAAYADYSHGVRLVDATCRLDGRDVPLASVLRDPSVASLLSAEGVLHVLRQPGS